MKKVFKSFFGACARGVRKGLSALHAHRRKILKAFLILLALAFLALVVWVLSFFRSPKNEWQQQAQADAKNNIVRDVTGLYPIKVEGVIVPHSTEEIQEAVKAHSKVSIGGGRYSMGGQTASEKAVQIDMREFNKILDFSTTTKEITVQAGIRWREIQERIDPEDLSVMVMQTYSNFTVGGSLSVNVHGRYVGLGPVIMSVRGFRLVLADGTAVNASPTENSELFYSAIGGMGGIGVITEVTLALADNVNVERQRVKMPISEYKDYFFGNVRESGDVVFHNGDIYPLDFDSVSAVSWTKTDRPANTPTRLIPRAKDYITERIAWVVMSEWPFGKDIREYILDPLIYSKDAVHSRNYEASYDVAELEPMSRKDSTYVLQEYFVPVNRFDEFYPKMKDVFVGNDVNVLNVSIRHAEKDPGATLAWANEEVFAFVVYYKQGTDEASRDHVARWTREMIDQVLSVGGTYYLPYQPHATGEQFLRAYPGALDYFKIKKKYDPDNKFTNNLWETYYDPEQIDLQAEAKAARDFASSTLAGTDYVRNVDNIYLTLPEWYIVYSAVEYANVLRDGLPSQFDYLGAIKEYWSEHGKVQGYAIGSPNQNSGYGLVLKVIGWSFTFENAAKWAYENTIGKLSEKVSGGRQSEEDRFAARLAKDYHAFIYDNPWYNFPYYRYYDELYRLPHDPSGYGIGGWVRKFERQMFLSFELTAKRFYSWVIRSATETKFGVQDDVITALVREDGAYGTVTAPHYQPFTVALKSKLDEALASGADFEILEIAGNSIITFSYLDEVGSDPSSLTKEILRYGEVQSIENGIKHYKDRITVSLPVRQIDEVHAELKQRGVEIDHFYDY